MSYIKEKQSYLEKNKLVVKVMMFYIEDYEFLYTCIGLDNYLVVEDVEEVIINLIDLQGDSIHYCPLTLA